ncbi:MAG: hypothetical protein Q7N87_04025, partial [Candidatus Uhrbacteria bacterium]|nr:hypothetical protein [Candidatus Uhrbacteria bacterium]
MIVRKKFFRFLSVAVTVFLSVGQPASFSVSFFEFFRVPEAQAAIATTLGYQGRLKTAAGVAQTGNFNFIFRLYTSLTGGTAVYTETQNTIAVDQSFFAVQLGSVTAFPGTFDFNQPLFLSTEVNGDGEMSPRVPINSTAYAYTSAGITALGSAPTSATGGRMYYNTANNIVYFFDAASSTWKAFRSTTGTLQQITDEGNVTTNAIQFQGGTSTGAFTASSNLTVSGSSSLQGLTWVNATGTNTTTTWLGFSTASGTNETIYNLTATNATSSWLGFTTASGTTGNIINLTSSNVTVTGGTINGTTIGATNASTGIFTSVTTTNATTTALAFTSSSCTTLRAINLTSSNVTITGGAIDGTTIGATNASTGAFTTLSATSLATLSGGILVNSATSTITNLTTINVTSSNVTTTWLGYTTASGTTETVYNVTSTGWLGCVGATGTSLRVNTLTVGTCTGCGGGSGSSSTLLGDTNTW